MILLAGIAALVLGHGPAALQGGLSAETGLEYDSNANRAETGGPDAMTPQPSPLLRLLLTGQLQQRAGRHSLNLLFTVGGKLFFLPDVQDQNVGVVQLSYEEGGQLGRLRLSGLLDYYDAYQAPATPLRSRDFRALSTGLRLGGGKRLSPGHSLDASLDIGGQGFMYKPDDHYSFLAPSATGRLVSRSHLGDPELGHDFEVGVSARFDYRGYLYGRQDDYAEFGATLGWVGAALVQLGYTYQLNVSNDPTQGYQRHLVVAKVAAPLPWNLYLTVKGQLNLLMSQSDVLVPIASIDEENRSLAMLDIERPLRKGFAVWARYTGYFDVGTLSGEDAPYQRHTVCLGVTYRRQFVRKPAAAAAP